MPLSLIESDAAHEAQSIVQHIPHQTLRLSQLRAQHFYAQSQSLAAEANQANQRAQQLESDLSIANQRIANLSRKWQELVSTHGAGPLSGRLGRGDRVDDHASLAGGIAVPALVIAAHAPAVVNDAVGQNGGQPSLEDQAMVVQAQAWNKPEEAEKWRAKLPPKEGVEE